ncbi:hypothetical protein [Neobacillus drentensis]|uniref:hypothetical protein n=1 Tax=Neobacillus drentensis TaxID=220684 RepID=UPI002FFF5941
MIIYDIEVVIVNENLVSIGKGYLNHNDRDTIKSWNIELYDVRNENIFSEILHGTNDATLKIGTLDGKSFIGRSIITKLEIGPLGTTVLLKGNGPLYEA